MKRKAGFPISPHNSLLQRCKILRCKADGWKLSENIPFLFIEPSCKRRNTRIRAHHSRYIHGYSWAARTQNGSAVQWPFQTVAFSNIWACWGDWKSYIAAGSRLLTVSGPQSRIEEYTQDVLELALIIERQDLTKDQYSKMQRLNRIILFGEASAGIRQFYVLKKIHLIVLKNKNPLKGCCWEFIDKI